ncbi:beta-fructofuranosidase, insoluble isoenzyme 1 isoform X2 [Gossypium hirsutum]|uniref:Beta-fructofuranosidase, insoluble isoenzyme 1 isoform X2 n=1 Tax=Gossypium hirsutum TaxID=3635 RepID=A0A1U8LEY3_GOSHI|nr:beta-fructofuranosidase, insoluble isoenzyme 1-like isoform X2 [Gossypium hirsutum]
MNWINDPNGPMYYNGIYHLFYQYNPKGAVWGNIVWAHSVSKDMVNWEALEPAIYPSESFDINGCWSGSATVLPENKPVIFYTGIDPNQYQVQNYAVPENLSDPYLRKWVKPADNPIVAADETMNKTAFRDPTTAWKIGGHWRMVVASRRKQRGMAYLYRSRDFRKWIKAKHPLHSVPNTGMFECADFFPVSLSGDTGLDNSAFGPNKHVLKVSLDLTRYEYYTIGSYFPEARDKYVVGKGFVDGWNGLRFDYGNFYASKTFFDPSKNRRILWGWTNESDAAQDDAQKGWAGLQAIPRKVWLDPSGKQLLQWPIEEIETLRGQNVQLSNQELKSGEHIEVKGITAAQVDVDITFSIPNLDKAEPFDPSWTNAQDLCGLKGSTVQGGVGPFGLLTLASEKLEEYTPVFFRVFTGLYKHVVLLCSDSGSSSLRKEGLYKPSFAGFVDVDLDDTYKISLRTLIDHSVVESFGAGGKTCITSRVYPLVAVFDDAHLFVFNNGTETITADVKAWSMAKPDKMNN